MTAHRDLKRIIRQRQHETGEPYTAARAHVMRERDALLGLPPEEPTTPPLRADAVVLKVNQQSARVRILGEPGQVTFRSPDVWQVVPGHLVTLTMHRRWTWRDDAYASGAISNPRIDVPSLGLVPLPLTEGEPIDLRTTYEPYEDTDPYARLWRTLTAGPRHYFDMDAIAWGSFSDTEPDDCPVDEAMEVARSGDLRGGRGMLMDLLVRDLRCLDAHAHLGHLAFDHAPDRAIVHYEIGVRIGELSLPPDFDGVLVWGRIYNRPFLRCLHGYGLCLWRLGQLEQAQRVFERILALNPNDNQGVRFSWHEVRQGLSWAEANARDAAS